MAHYGLPQKRREKKIHIYIYIIISSVSRNLFAVQGRAFIYLRLCRVDSFYVYSRCH